MIDLVIYVMPLENYSGIFDSHLKVTMAHLIAHLLMRNLVISEDRAVN